MKKIAANIFWLLLALAGGWAFFALASNHGQPISSGYILIAALCTYAIGFRFYSKWIAARVLALNDRRATPCEVRDDGKDLSVPIPGEAPHLSDRSVLNDNDSR